MNYMSPDDARLPLFSPTPDAEEYRLKNLNVLEPVTHAIANASQVPPAMAAHSVLCAAALAAQGIANVELPHGKISPLSLNIITTAKSGARKTTSDGYAMEGVSAREKELEHRLQDEMAEYTAAMAIFNSRRVEIEKGTPNEEDRKRALIDLIKDEPKCPLLPKLTIGNTTAEGILKQMRVLSPSIAIATDEGGTMMNGYSFKPENAPMTFGVFNKFWDGAEQDIVRAGGSIDPRQATKIRGRRVSMHLMVQEELCMKLLSSPGFKDQGLLARFLMATPKSIQGTRLYKDTLQSDRDAISTFKADIARILRRPHSLVEGTQNELSLPSLTICEEAKEHWIAFYNSLEIQSGPGGDLEAIDTFAAKAAENAARIAGIFTIIKSPTATVIEYPEMYDAICLMNWYANEALRISGHRPVDENLKRADDILKWLIKHRNGTATQRDIMNAGPGHLTLSEFLPVLKILEDHGLATSTVKARSKIITAVN